MCNILLQHREETFSKLIEYRLNLVPIPDFVLLIQDMHFYWIISFLTFKVYALKAFLRHRVNTALHPMLKFQIMQLSTPGNLIRLTNETSVRHRPTQGWLSLFVLRQNQLKFNSLIVFYSLKLDSTCICFIVDWQGTKKLFAGRLLLIRFKKIIVCTEKTLLSNTNYTNSFVNQVQMR